MWDFEVNAESGAGVPKPVHVPSDLVALQLEKRSQIRRELNEVPTLLSLASLLERGRFV